MTDLPTAKLPAILLEEELEAPDRLTSEQIVISAPMSLTGAAERGWKLTRRQPKWAWVIFAVFVIALWWTLVAGWYLFFGLLLVPYRLVRRGQRKRRLEATRHRETLGAIEKR